MDTSELITTVIYLLIVSVICIFGFYGNLNVIWATIRKKEFRGKHGLLLFIMVNHHTVCLLFELIFIIVNQFVEEIRTDTCSYLTAVYYTAISMQECLELLISIDLLVAVCLPIKHRVWSTIKYLPIICLPAVIFSFSFTAAALSTTDRTSSLTTCTSISSLRPCVLGIWLAANLVINALIIVVYCMIMLKLHLKGENAPKKVANDNVCVMRKKTDEQKVLSSLSLMIAVFEVTWCSYIFFHSILYLFPYLWTEQLKILPSVFSLICFSQTFYVCRFRSVEYRKAFRDQFRILTCKKKKSKKAKGKGKIKEKEPQITSLTISMRTRTMSISVQQSPCMIEVEQ